MICYRCLTPQTVSETRQAKRIKGLSREQSEEFRRCKACDCRTFITGPTTPTGDER